MKIKMLRFHNYYNLYEEHEVTEERGNYLIRIGAAKEVKEVVQEKVEKIIRKEKAENKTGNVPTAKKRK